ncbi:fimbrial protein [Serratia fonticola]|uniref:fimbrial protein n=1 Tax=Serratia fonticola TaxID=47917 RepID=UPI00192CBA93|nr:fimbrial protein [Serratia fonticola]MBL5905352.1 type 1 fimbrial protein [Serratia fonticola]
MVMITVWYAAALLLCSQPSIAAKNMRFHGALVAEPCVISPGDETVVLDFDTVLDKYLYMNTRTHGQPFKLHLSQCDLSLGKTVKVTFSGDGSAVLPGLLALNGASQASGIAIGMETPQGELLPINQPGKAQALANGSNTLTVQAYVQGEPEALAKKAITRGPFSAVATFSLEYE